MAFATLKIFALDKAQGGYPAELSEDGKAKVSGLLPVAAFSTGAWTVNLDPAIPPPASDIVATVVATEGKDRPTIDWPSLTETLFNLLFPAGALRDAYAKFDDDTELVLDIEPAELTRVPWELARSIAPPRRLSVHYAMSRLHSAAANNRSSLWPFRILIVIGCAKAEEETLGVAKEVEQIRRVFLSYGRSVSVKVLHRPIWDDLKLLIRGDPSREDGWEPHVLHFVGHTALANPFGLKIESNDAGSVPWVWDAKSIEEDFPLFKWKPKFVFLNACRTGDDPGGAWSMQRSFINVGTQCVLTLQADVNGALAGLFAGKLYQNIAAGLPVQTAAREARLAIHGVQKGTELIDWGLPSLTTAGGQLVLFTPRAPPVDPEYDKCEEFENARMFANCDEGRRLLTAWMCPARPVSAAAKPSNVLMLNGLARSGKSHLLKWAMESWLLAGARVRYIELDDGTARGFVSVLRQIRDGAGKGSTRLLQKRLPTAAFKRFNWALVKQLKGDRPGEWIDSEHPGDEVDDDPQLTLLPANSEERPEPQVCAEFLAALRLVSDERPLVLVFDKFIAGASRLVSPEDFEQIVTHLFKPIALEKNSRIKLVFCANPIEFDTYKLGSLPSVNCPIPTDMKDPELVSHAVEMMRFGESLPPTDAEAKEAELRGLAQEFFKAASRAPGAVPQGMAKIGILISVLRAFGYTDPPRMR